MIRFFTQAIKSFLVHIFWFEQNGFREAVARS